MRSPPSMVPFSRDVKFLTTLPGARDRRYGEDLRAALKHLCAGISHGFLAVNPPSTRQGVTMTEQVSEQSIFLHAAGLPSSVDRAAYLDEVCRGNAALRTELDALLAANDRLGGLSPTTGHDRADDSAAEAPQAVLGSVDVGAVVSGRYKLIEPIDDARHQQPVSSPSRKR